MVQGITGGGSGTLSTAGDDSSFILPKHCSQKTIQDAIDAYFGTKDIVLPYAPLTDPINITSPLTIPNYIGILRGHGRNTVLKCMSNLGGTGEAVIESASMTASSTHVTLRDFMVFGNSATYDVNGIKGLFSGGKFEGLDIRGCSQAGLWTLGTAGVSGSGVRIRDCRIFHDLGSGDQGTAATIGWLQARYAGDAHCLQSYFGENAISVNSQGGDLTFVGNELWGTSIPANSGKGLVIDGTGQTGDVVGNYFGTFNMEGIKIDASAWNGGAGADQAYWNIVSNTFSLCGYKTTHDYSSILLKAGGTGNKSIYKITIAGNNFKGDPTGTNMPLYHIEEQQAGSSYIRENLYHPNTFKWYVTAPILQLGSATSYNDTYQVSAANKAGTAAPTDGDPYNGKTILVRCTDGTILFAYSNGSWVKVASV